MFDIKEECSFYLICTIRFTVEKKEYVDWPLLRHLLQFASKLRKPAFR